MVLGNSMIESITPSVNGPLGESRGECERELSSTVSERFPSPEEESKMIYLVSIIKEKILKLAKETLLLILQFVFFGTKSFKALVHNTLPTTTDTQASKKMIWRLWCK
jgi:hypothetical protein